MSQWISANWFRHSISNQNVQCSSQYIFSKRSRFTIRYMPHHKSPKLWSGRHFSQKHCNIVRCVKTVFSSGQKCLRKSRIRPQNLHQLVVSCPSACIYRLCGPNSQVPNRNIYYQPMRDAVSTKITFYNSGSGNQAAALNPVDLCLRTYSRGHQETAGNFWG